MVEKQSRFTKAVSIFIQKAGEIGYKFTFGEAWRSTEAAEYYAEMGKGISKSLHIIRLAIDLNAFYNGKYLDGDEESEIPHLEKLGKLWESISPEASWGGRFKKKDYNHYSFEHNGIR